MSPLSRRDFALCSVCKKQILEARLLICGHTFCMRCLQQQWDSSQQIKCWTCEKVTEEAPQKLQRNLDVERIACEVEEIYSSQAETQKLEVLKFHEKCSGSIKVCPDGRSAERVDTAESGLVLSSRPLKADETFEVTLDELDSSVFGSVAIGIVNCNPDSLDELPSKLNDWKASSVFFFSKTSLFEFDADNPGATTERKNLSKISLSSLDAFDRVGLKISRDGDLSFLVKGEDVGVCASDISSRWWAVVDLSGSTKKISIAEEASDLKLNRNQISTQAGAADRGSQQCGVRDSEGLVTSASHVSFSYNSQVNANDAENYYELSTTQDDSLQKESLQQDSLQNPQLPPRPTEENRKSRPQQLGTELGSLQNTPASPPEPECEDTYMHASVSSLENDSKGSTLPQTKDVKDDPAKSNALLFHQRSLGVQLSACGRVASRELNSSTPGLLPSCRPLRDSEIFEVTVSNTNGKPAFIQIGIADRNPEEMDKLPISLSVWPNTSVCYYMRETDVKRNRENSLKNYSKINLKTLKDGDSAGVCVTRSGDLHFFVNNKNLGLAARGLRQPMWAVVETMNQTVKLSLKSSNMPPVLQGGGGGSEGVSDGSPVKDTKKKKSSFSFKSSAKK